MSKATKCDRCGQCFCASDTDAELVTFDDVCFTNGETRPYARFFERKEAMDFCPDCTWAFRRFMEDYKIEEEAKNV